MPVAIACGFATLLALSTLAGCGAADGAEDAAERVEQALQRVECVHDQERVCPAGERAWQLLELALDDCYEIVSIDRGPDAACCFTLTVKLSVDTAMGCL